MVFFISICALVTTTGTTELKVTAYVDETIGVEIEEDKVSVTV